MDVDYFRRLSADFLQSNERPYPHSITIADLVQYNAPLVNLDQLIDPESDLMWRHYLIYDVDFRLAQYFPIIGAGTEKLVFDIGTAVLKRYVSDGRMWEFALNRLAAEIPGLYSPEYQIPVSDSDEILLVQEKLIPIDRSAYQDLIFRYYPQINHNKYVNPGDWQSWEWGLDPLGIPHVYDWG